MSLVDRLAAAKASADLQPVVGAVPFARFLGLSARLDGSELVTTMRYADRLIGNPTLPALHGGTLGALLEAAATFELLWRIVPRQLPETITLTIDYLRSGEAVDTHACCVVTRVGRRVANVRVDAWQAERATPVATAHAIFLVSRD